MESRQSGLIKFVLAIILVAVGFTAGQASPKLIHLSSDPKTIDFENLNDIYDLLQRKFDGHIDEGKVMDGARAGLVASAGDPYTVYLDAKSAKDLDNQLKGQLSGIGAEVGIKNNKLTIISPIDGSPARTAGLAAGDVVARINNEDTSGMPLDEAVGKIRGNKGTKVTLKVIRGNSEPKDYEITRDTITVTSVKWSMKPGSIGYIQITEFGSDTADKIKQAADELRAQGASKIILDVRNDPGGYLDAAVTVASQFMPAGKVVVEEKHGGQTRDKLESQAGGGLIGLSVVVLINEGSASASEIVAGALHDNIAAKLVGVKSFGKGSVQEITKLTGGAELKITVAHWFTPAGKTIDKQGIKPDIEVKLGQDDFNAGRDPQLDRALAELK
ncbi:MAG TPA: S41 family peptidase [Candidatus Saccharimonadales bacterium]|nr:S41 family peptidase [Candidatus Saccharimonadales bacterium]